MLGLKRKPRIRQINLSDYYEPLIQRDFLKLEGRVITVATREGDVRGKVLLNKSSQYHAFIYWSSRQRDCISGRPIIIPVDKPLSENDKFCYGNDAPWMYKCGENRFFIEGRTGFFHSRPKCLLSDFGALKQYLEQTFLF